MIDPDVIGAVNFVRTRGKSRLEASRILRDAAEYLEPSDVRACAFRKCDRVFKPKRKSQKFCDARCRRAEWWHKQRD